MIMKYPIQLERSACSRLAAFDFTNIEFGPTATDHMFCADYRNGTWEDAAVKPFAEFAISPLALCLHYGQTVFEGMKAFRLADGSVSIFRPDKHLLRINRSLERTLFEKSTQESLMIHLRKTTSSQTLLKMQKNSKRK